MQFHHHGYVSADPRILPAAGTGIDRPAEIPDEVDVLIVGSGPAGMLLAAQLSQYPGLTTRIIEQRDGRLVLGQADGQHRQAAAQTGALIACRHQQLGRHRLSAGRQLGDDLVLQALLAQAEQQDGDDDHRGQGERHDHRGEAGHVEIVATGLEAVDLETGDGAGKYVEHHVWSPVNAAGASRWAALVDMDAATRRFGCRQRRLH